MAPNLSIVFAGTSRFGAAHLKTLLNPGEHDNWQVQAVITGPDRIAGRGHRLQPNPVKRLYADCAAESSIALHQPSNLSNDEIHIALRRLAPDLIVVVAYGLLIPPSILNLPRLGCINVHPSLLPRWRGGAPIQRAIAAGDDRTGVSIMQMDRGLDTGPVLLQQECTISATDNAATLEQTLIEIGSALLRTALRELQHGSLPPQAQDDSRSCYAATIAKAETWVSWKDHDAGGLARLSRAFWPDHCLRVRLTESASGDSLKLHAAQAEQSASQAAPGTILAWSTEKFLVACRHGALSLETVQLSGQPRPMSISDLYRGRPERFQLGQLLP